ncbi:MAG: hypothetical protein JOY70_07950 [Acidisphaera sp.]|nr:hypothetical protein [Acidisphaera sp.]MBV9813081.1 hypothetical protein [Acetobacteraceae bacterium]
MGDGAVSTAGRPARDRASRLWLQGLLCGGLIALAAPAALLFGVLLVPAAIAAIGDVRPRRPPIRALLCAGTSCAVQPLLTWWHGGHDWAAALGVLTDFRAIAAAWSAQAAVWLGGELIPLSIRLALDMRCAARGARLRAERARLEAEWDLPPVSAPDVQP